MKTITQQPYNWKWTRPIDNDGKMGYIPFVFKRITSLTVKHLYLAGIFIWR